MRCVISDKRGERTKQNEFEAQNEDMSEDFDISQEETGFPLVKYGNFASFAPVNKCWFLRETHPLRLRPTSSAGTAVSRKRAYDS